jgi:hypothetical protein
MREYCDNCGEEIWTGQPYFVVYAEIKGYEEDTSDVDCTKMCKKCYNRY